MITNQIMSGQDATVPQLSIEMEIGDHTEGSFEAQFSANNSGTLFLEVSNTGAFWSGPLTQVTVTAQPAALLNMNGAGYRYVRIRWTPSAGAGTLSIVAIVKEPPNRF